MSDNEYLTQEQIAANFNQLEGLCERLGDRVPAIKFMLEEMGIRIATAPASSRKAFHAAYPGGLVDHTLRVCKNALTLKKSFDLFDKLSNESVIFSAIFHDFGKVGQPGPSGGDYYLVQDSDWHRQKLGQYYKSNEGIQFMSNVDHTIRILIHYGIKASEEEYLAIRLNDGPYDEGNKKYGMREPTLAILIHMADRLACEMEKDLDY